MKRMPEKIKVKLRQLQKLHKRAAELDREITKLFEQYGVNTDNLCAMGDSWSSDIQTEALAFITNAEGDVEENIQEIEEVFLYYVNLNK